MQQTTVAVLITCHNRKQKTLNILSDLFSQVLPADVKLYVYLVDDGSTDGTAEAVRKAYPQVNILLGDGSLFWNGAMRQALATASQNEHDYYLWLNDDTVLNPEALGIMLATSVQLAQQGYRRSLVVGSICDPQSGKLTYGGLRRSSWWHTLRFALVEPSQEVKPCETMNGNCVLIARAALQAVDNLDPAFSHYLGDWDYGLQAKKQGCTVWLAPGYMGKCELNSHLEQAADPDMSLSEQWQQVNHPKGLVLRGIVLQPFQELKVFAQKHGGLLWPIFWLLPYRRLLLNLMLERMNKYIYH
jgi:GT2 family glycosyltransferase